ncbi:HAD hydrolase-like protein [Aurantimonas aggregata]|uniref:Phosphoglycolate phosphatase n=1 Tax=Aurantimonas aggregata TaxID=2047720 RepID=A0A6L9MC13_9HYPH|nr:HAD family hydrolase [Aurantimonas aggregata]NDV85231.1 HAD hydrolase-like protein [Aurantimonas aggregata]
MTDVAVFDLDGTLVDTAPDLTASLNYCLAAAGMDAVPLDLVRPHAGHGARVMLRQAYGWDGRPLGETEEDEQLSRFLEHYEANIAVQSRPFPGALDAMERLAAGGFTLAVCTNKHERLAVLLLSELGMAYRFAAICGADTFARRKPDPLHLTGTIDRSFGKPAGSIMIGDTITDIATARAAGVASVLVDFGYAPDPEARAGATVVIDDYARLDAAFARQIVARAALRR